MNARTASGQVEGAQQYERNTDQQVKALALGLDESVQRDGVWNVVGDGRGNGNGARHDRSEDAPQPAHRLHVAVGEVDSMLSLRARARCCTRARGARHDLPHDSTLLRSSFTHSGRCHQKASFAG